MQANVLKKVTLGFRTFIQKRPFSLERSREFIIIIFQSILALAFLVALLGAVLFFINSAEAKYLPQQNKQIIDQLTAMQTTIDALKVKLDKSPDALTPVGASPLAEQPHQELQVGPLNIFIGITFINAKSESVSELTGIGSPEPTAEPTADATLEAIPEETQVAVTETTEATVEVTEITAEPTQEIVPTQTPTFVPTLDTDREVQIAAGNMKDLCPNDPKVQPETVKVGYTYSNWQVFHCWAYAFADDNPQMLALTQYDGQAMEWTKPKVTTLIHKQDLIGLIFAPGIDNGGNANWRPLMIFFFQNESGAVRVLIFHLQTLEPLKGESYLGAFEFKSNQDQQDKTFKFDADELTITRGRVGYKLNRQSLIWDQQ